MDRNKVSSFSHNGSSLSHWVFLVLVLLLSVLAQGFQFPLTTTTTMTTTTTHPSRSTSSTSTRATTAFVRKLSPPLPHHHGNVPAQEAGTRTTALFMSSYSADGSEYSSKETDYEDDGLPGDDYDFSNQSEQEMAPTVELQPVPMSKNAGNRFVALVWDQELDTSSNNRDAMELHEDRDALTEDHVMFCRKRNLYNETFNTDSMVDIFWSLQTYVIISMCFYL
jgi:hypothetical protein